MDNDKVSYQKITKPHFERTLARAVSGVWLSICDTTELSFSLKRTIKGLKPLVLVLPGLLSSFFPLVSDETGEMRA